MSWQVLYLRPRCEKKMAAFAQGLNMDYRLPLRSETRVYQYRKVLFENPVFPGYFFVRVNDRERNELLKTNHIVRMITPPDEARLVHELDQIQLALSVDPTLGACTALRKGRRVRIKGGPFMGVEGVVRGNKGFGKVRLNVDLIGQAVAIEVDRDLLEVME